MPDNLIEFHCVAEDIYSDSLPKPIPAAQGVPDWLKQMPAKAAAENPAGGEVFTVKKCPPVVDALTSGYLIPLVGDVEFEMHAADLKIRSSLPLIRSHPRDQIAGSGFDNGAAIVKFLNPWIVKTPPGYSCLFLPLLNRYDFPFRVISGVIETDKYYREVNFPAVCLLRPGQRFVAKRGTPLVQAIPFRREAWESVHKLADMEHRRGIEKENPVSTGLYRATKWERKSYL
jgi:hypothetical protein